MNNDFKNTTLADGTPKYYFGFGEWKTAAGWAGAFGLSRMSVSRYLKRGMSPEEIAEIRGIENPNLATRTKYKGPRQEQTKAMVEDLLDASDYDPDGVEVVNISGRYRHKVIWNDLVIGVYSPSTDVLWLNGGDHIKLEKPFVPDQRIYHEGGVWHMTPETKAAILAEQSKLKP